MEELDVIERINQPTDWCSPVVVVPRKNGAVRICEDFITPNKAVKWENHHMVTTKQTFAKVVSKLDANPGFWQIKVRTKSKCFTTFITPCGLYCYRRLLFGISSAADTGGIGQNRMSNEQHDVSLEAVFNCLKEYGVTLNPEKCEFSKEKISFLDTLVIMELNQYSKWKLLWMSQNWEDSFT